ncbi:recombinase family protein [Synechococcus sp. 1G10]|uniref:recombinase family protein n=1 Tax=Synechococcus sp. 1G10 TaxID=2025605 RepID=UPI000B984EDE|nr:recombinase family protein [Synechococcus sp. 1G10]
MDLVAYYRVSTQRQGQSGLGLEAQKARVEELALQRNAKVVAEFVEVESGRKPDRPQLAAALEEARKQRAAVAVAKLDRLARDAELVLRLSREAEANGLAGFLFCDLPDVDATTSAGRLILSVMASVAEFESRRISERTRDALNAAKVKGKALGARLPKQAAANAERAAQAQQVAEKLAGIIRPMRERGDSMQTIAEALTGSGVPTTGGKGKWNAMGVKRVLARLGLS